MDIPKFNRIIKMMNTNTKNANLATIVLDDENCGFILGSLENPANIVLNCCFIFVKKLETLLDNVDIFV